MPHTAIRITSILLLIASNTIFIIPLPISATVYNASETDRRALLCLKSQLHDPSGALASWRSESHSFCGWHGITCGKKHASRVVALDLESHNITGQIFPCVSLLSFLERIHMPNNNLCGQITPSISRLSKLRYLNLSVNSLSGEIPYTISSCSYLETIDLYKNSIDGVIPSSLAQSLHLQSIILSNNNLHGRIPPGFGLLPNLSAMFFPNNQLTGSIPEFLGSTRHLRWLNLKNNSLSGRIPPALFNSTSLSHIDLSQNYLSGYIPHFLQASSSTLEYLSLTFNNLSGEIPHSLGNQSSLSVLLLAHNNLEGCIPDILGKLARLYIVNMNDNMLSCIIPRGLYNISSLTYLGLGANKFVGRIPVDIGYNLPSIRDLVLEGNLFEGQIPASLANASNMQLLDLRGNAFTGIIPSLGSLTMLTYLDLGENRLEAGNWFFMSALTNCTQLQNLWLDTNNLQGTVFTYIVNISKSIEVLVLMENQLTGAITPDIGSFINLAILQLDNNLLSGTIPDTIGNLQNLYILGLSQNKLSGEIPQSIGKLEQLTELHLEHNDLIGLIPSSLLGCKHLTRLNLSSNSLNGSIPLELFSLFTLSEGLDLSYNQLTGEIPSAIGKLINLNSLNLSNNKLSGEIPSTLGACILLDSLHMESNFLRGDIPKSLISLRGLTEMDLSHNNLSGGIPDFFETFSSLKILNLSFNDLEGPVPLGFPNSCDVFLQGNSKLCATSQLQQLPLCETSSLKSKKKLHTTAVVVPLATIVAATMSCIAVNIMMKRRKAEVLTSQPFKEFKTFSYDDLFRATDGFSPACIVGSGTFGFVYKGQFLLEACSVAVKVFRLDQHGARHNFLAECEALRNIRHRNLITVISLCSTFDPSGNEFKALILEYMPNGNLESWLHPELQRQRTERSLSLGSCINIAVDIAAALDYLHNRCSPPLVHRDLKPSNVLLDDEMVARVSDFGLAKFHSTDYSTGIHNSSSMAGPGGSIGYIAPEYGMGCKLSIEGDIYSYGIILLEMITGKRPTDVMFRDGVNLRNFVELSVPHKINEILHPDLIGCHEADEYINQAMVGMQTSALELVKLGLNCSEMSPKDRPTTEKVYTEIMAIKEEFLAMSCDWEN